jgi:hypothetical protein
VFSDRYYVYPHPVAGKDRVLKDETDMPSQPPYNIMPTIIPNLIWDKDVED